MSETVTKVRWTEKEDRQLKKLLSGGETYDTIAATMGRSRGSIAGRIYFLRDNEPTKLPKGYLKRPAAPEELDHSRDGKRWTPEEDDALREFIAGNGTVADLEVRLKRTRAAIYSRRIIIQADKFNKISTHRPRPNNGTVESATEVLGTLDEQPTSLNTLSIELSRGQIHDAYPFLDYIEAKTKTVITLDRHEDKINVTSANISSCEVAKYEIERLFRTPEVGEIFTGKIVNVTDFGAFVQITPTVRGLLHIKNHEGYDEKTRVNATTVFKNGEIVTARCEFVDVSKNKYSLCTKNLYPEVIEPEEENDEEVTQIRNARDITKEMTKLARQLARSSGKKMVMAIYFIEGEGEGFDDNQE